MENVDDESDDENESNSKAAYVDELIAQVSVIYVCFCC